MLLKIKDDVDLKELEKFGFILNKKGQYEKRFTLIYKNRKISGRSGDKAFSKLYIAYELYDIIKARFSRKGVEYESYKLYWKDKGFRI